MAKEKSQSAWGLALNGPQYNNILKLQRKIEKIRSILECWKFRRLTLLGKIAVLKSLVASQLVYIQLFRERLSEKICARDNPER